MSWQEVTLGDVCSNVQYGYTASASEDDGGYPQFLRITDIVNDVINWETVPFCPIADDNIEKYLLRPGDIVVARTGNTTGYAKLIRHEAFAVFASYLIRFQIDNERAVAAYVGRLVESQIFKTYVNQVKGGAAQGGANAKTLSQFPFSLPPLPTQRRIAGILSAYDDLIENNLKRIRLLEEAAQNIYREWFVEMRFPGWEDVVQKPRQTSKNELPKDWKYVDMGDFCGVFGGGTPSTKVPAYWDGGTIFWFSPTDLSKNSSLVLIDSSQRITEEGLRNSSARLMPSRTILMSSRATIGLFGIISQPCATNQGFINIVPNYEWERFYILFNLKMRVNEIQSHASGATFKEISKKTFRSMSILSPDAKVLQNFHCTVKPIIDKIENMEFQNRLLKEAQDILLPRLMDGTIQLIID